MFWFQLVHFMVTETTVTCVITGSTPILMKVISDTTTNKFAENLVLPVSQLIMYLWDLLECSSCTYCSNYQTGLIIYTHAANQTYMVLPSCMLQTSHSPGDGAWHSTYIFSRSPRTASQLLSSRCFLVIQSFLGRLVKVKVKVRFIVLYHISFTRLYNLPPAGHTCQYPFSTPLWEYTVHHTDFSLPGLT